MAIYVNGIKVAGRGISGKSPYQIAKDGGYTGTEAEFNDQLVAIGEATKGFNELFDQVNNAKADVEAAVAQADAAVSQALIDINAAKQDISITVINAKKEIDDAVKEALLEIPNVDTLATKDYVTQQIANAKVGYATETYVNDKVSGLATETYVNGKVADMATQTYVNSKVTDMATQTWVTTQINNATAAIVTDVWYYGSSAPDSGKSGEAATKARKLLWIDSNTSTGGLKYYNGSSWAHVPVAWQ